MGIQRLGIQNPSASTNTTLFSSTSQYLVSVIASNKSTTTPSNIRVWVEPSGSSSSSQYAYIVYDLQVDQSNSFETFRFAVNQNDVIKVRASTSDISFAAYGIIQFDINIGLGVSSYQSTSPSNPITGQIWVDSDTDIFYVYDGTSWVLLAGSATTTSSDPAGDYEDTFFLMGAWYNFNIGGINAKGI